MRGAFPPEHDGWPRYGIERRFLDRKQSGTTDVIIRLCIGGHFSWKQTDKALRLYGFNELYAKNKRDACIIVALNNRIFDLYRVNVMLEEQGLSPLEKETE